MLKNFVDKIFDVIFGFYFKHPIWTRLLLGILFTAGMMAHIIEQNSTYSEKMDTTQWIISFIGVSYVCFGIPWGFSRLKMIQWDQFTKIPFIGDKLYIIFKIGIGGIIGIPVMIYHLFRYIISKKRRLTENTWVAHELETEKNNRHYSG